MNEKRIKIAFMYKSDFIFSCQLNYKNYNVLITFRFTLTLYPRNKKSHAN
jgi:hypothetical protein